MTRQILVQIRDMIDFYLKHSMIGSVGQKLMKPDAERIMIKEVISEVEKLHDYNPPNYQG